MSFLFSILIVVFSFLCTHAFSSEEPPITTDYEYDAADFKTLTDYPKEDKKRLFSMIENHDPKAIPLIKELMRTNPDIQYLRIDDGITPFIYAAYNNNVAALKTFYHHNADIHVRDYNGGNAFIYTVTGNSLEAFNFLIDKGYDINDQENLYQVTPLMLAATKGYKSIVELLLFHSADANLKSDQADAIGAAIHHGHKDIEELLRSYILDKQIP